jgi:voltage-gated potassium channel
MSEPNRAQRPLRNKIHEIIFGSHTPLGMAFDVMLLLAIIVSIVVTSMETVEQLGPDIRHTLAIFKWFFTILFTVEYFLRVYSVKRPLKYIFSFWGIIDLLAVLPDYILLFLGFFGPTVNSNAFSVFRSLRLLRAFRILNLAWFQYEAEELGSAIWRARGKIIVFLMVVMIIVTLAGTIMYEVEKWAPVNEMGESIAQIDSIPTGIYWSIVTMTTVGFGDIVPITIAGKFVSAILILVGYSLIIVPTGFVSAEVMEQKNRSKREGRNCPSCLSEGHEQESIYCRLCGERLD